MSTGVYVYIVSMIDFGKQKLIAPTKVGISENPQRRADEINGYCPFEMSLFASVLFPSRAYALAAEEYVHDALNEHFLKREWFDVEPEGAAFILYAYTNNFIASEPLFQGRQEEMMAFCGASKLMSLIERTRQ